MRELRNFRVTQDEHQRRTELHLGAGSKFYDSVQSFDFSMLQDLRAYARYPELVPLSSDPRFQKMRFGAVNSVAKSGCVCFVTQYIIRLYTNSMDMRSWAVEVAERGYRSWRFKNFPQITFTTPYVDIDEVKRKFRFVPNVEECESVNRLVTVLGPVEGIGGSMFLVDNVIADLARKYGRIIIPVKDTRLNSVEELIENLKKGMMVPIRVNNAVYHNDQNRKEGHYVCLIQIENGLATVMDPAIGFHTLSAERLIKAMTADKNLIAAWDISKI